MEREQVDKILKQMESKLESAEQLRTQAIETKVERAKKESEKLLKVLKTQKVLEKEKETKINERLEKIEISFQKHDALQK